MNDNLELYKKLQEASDLVSNTACLIKSLVERNKDLEDSIRTWHSMLELTSADMQNKEIQETILGVLSMMKEKYQ
tara:strand:+ start:754 stop:978 length:225 start_codon:yes stop_codon:yes gene_type:complete